MRGTVSTGPPAKLKMDARGLLSWFWSSPRIPQEATPTWVGVSEFGAHSRHVVVPFNEHGPDGPPPSNIYICSVEKGFIVVEVNGSQFTLTSRLLHKLLVGTSFLHISTQLFSNSMRKPNSY